jgi:DNA-binding MarR family transcriptional regulator
MTDDKARKAAKLREVISTLRKFSTFDHKMQVSAMLTLLEIAYAEALGRDISTNDIETRVGLKSGTASRNIYYWEGGHQENTGGHGFVSVRINPNDRRRRDLRLTAKGTGFINSLIGD